MLKANKYQIFIVILFVAICAGNPAIFAQNTDKQKLLKENTTALKNNTVAVKELTALIKKGGFIASAGVKKSKKVIVPKRPTIAQLKKIIKTLKWQTNDSYKGFGDPRAQKGGTLKYGMSAFPPTLRPIGKNSSSMFISLLESMCYEGLLDLDPVTYNYVPNLADKWAIADDKVTFFFEIDKRAKWSDGYPVTAKDVVATWNLLTDKGLEDPFSNDYWNKYEKPIAVTDRIVMIRSKHLNWRAFMSAGFMTIFPGHIISKMTGAQFLKAYQFKMMPGSGPYTYESSITNEEIVLTRRKDWWQKDFARQRGYNNFDKVDFVFIQDENLIKEKFKKGDLDWIYVNVAREWHQEFTAAKMPEIEKGWIQKRKVYTQRPVGVSGIAFNLRKPPFNDIRIRKAIAYLYNREKMMDKLFFNEYEYLDTFYPNSPYENPNDPKIRFNPDKAVKLLEEAGWLQKNRNSDGWLTKNGKIFELTLNYVQKSSERIMTIFQEDLRSVGIKLDLKQVTWASDIKQVGERNFEMSSRAYGGLLFPNPESSFDSKFADEKNNNNIWGLKNKRIDEICAKYPTMFDPQERIKAVQEIDGIACNLYLYAFGWYAAHTRLLYWNKFGMPDFILSKTGDQTSLVSLWWYDKAKEKALRKAMKNNTSLPVGKEVVRWWDEHYPRNAKKGN